MSFPDFISGLVNLALVGLFAGFTAFRLRARLMPGWSGSPARLVEAVLGVGLLVISSEMLGLFGLLEPLPLVILLGLNSAIAECHERLAELNRRGGKIELIDCGGW